MIYAVIDTETIGFKPPTEGSGVCEISIRIIDEDTNELKHFYSRLNPEAPISAGATAVHGIYDKDVQDCSTLQEWLEAEQVFQEDDTVIFIAHSAAFDLRFLQPYLPKNTLEVDTVKLARRYWSDAESHKLQVLRVIHGIDLNLADQHTAGGDTDTLLKVLRLLVRDSGLSLKELCAEAQKPEVITLMPFGKYRGIELVKVAAVDRKYLIWCLGNLKDLSADLKSAIEKALKGNENDNETRI